MKIFLVCLFLAGCGSNRIWVRTTECSEAIDIARNTERIKVQEEIKRLEMENKSYSDGLDYWIHEARTYFMELQKCKNMNSNKK